MTSANEPQPETRAVRGGRTPDVRALAPVLWASTTFEIDSLAEGRRLAHSSRAAEFYSRHGNPTVNAFEEAVAELEGAEAARAFASGMGAL
ncbi:MAG: PLP-dependent transferase, partial [Ilumatobacteraceae bacterium]